MDSKTKTTKQDRIRVDSMDPSEVEYVHRKFPHLSHQAVHGAIRAAGPMRDAVMEYLKKKHG